MRKRVLVLVGATAVGKTEVAIELAQLIDAEIVSADSVAVYTGLDIGSAKPTQDQRQRAVFHLVDIVSPESSFSSGDFQHLATEVIDSVLARGKWAVLTGGSGLYVRAAVDGLSTNLPERDDALRERLQNIAQSRGREHIHKILQRLDPASAKQMPAGNLKRCIRAIEIIIGAGRPASELFAMDAEREPTYPDAVFFGLRMHRDILRDRIDARVDQMIAQGFVHEVQALLESGVPADCLSMQSLGYKEIVCYLKGEYTLEQAIWQIKNNTRKFAKRQDTWFRADQRITWVDTASLNARDAAEIIKEGLTQ